MYEYKLKIKKKLITYFFNSQKFPFLGCRPNKLRTAFSPTAD